MRDPRRIAALAAAALLLAGGALAESAPYQSYTYDYRENIVITPAPYLPAAIVSGASLGITALNQPRDIAISDDGRLYIADSGNDRIVVTDASASRAVMIIDAFDNNGVADGFSAPMGVALSSDGQLYVADSKNRRIVVLDADGATLVKVFENPSHEALPDGFAFTPLRVAVDYAGRVYVIAQNMFQGIMVFEPDGGFTGFFGTINVTVSLWQRFWRAIASKQERANARLFVPTEFTGLDVDPYGFVYASNMDPQGQKAVRRLNPKGEDVAIAGVSGNLGGDLRVASDGPYSGVSRIVDVAYQGRGIYSLLDSQRGRVFTYDREGNLLYIFGGLGSQAGTFRSPAAIEYAKDGSGTLFALDYVRGDITVFRPTEYGALINEAVGLRFDGDETLAVGKWREALRLNENLELANAGIGKAYLAAGDNRNAMRYLKLGMSRYYYSIAFRRYRNEILKANLGWALTAAAALAVVVIAIRAAGRGRGESAGASETGMMDDG
ncbi:MAG: NHL repeat-containing protein [Oscillospiraceae bacterium]|nr:NHL repeat-containing protein [Oscillospiraceae bacterium]